MARPPSLALPHKGGGNPGLGEMLRRLGLVQRGEAAKMTPLAGGVSSDISLIETGRRRFCVKRALPRLKVAALWEAPVERNAAEAAYLRAVSRWLPRAVPLVLAEDSEAGLFAMDYLPPERFPLWKAELLDGRVDQTFAAAVGRDLALIHSRSAAEPEMRKAFAHDATFEAIRIEPYLRATARAHPALAARLDALAETTLSTKRALVHGDVSPKNILIGPDGPVFLDAECAWFGDPAFDVAFCLNHLLLKGARAGASTRRPISRPSPPSPAPISRASTGRRRAASRRAPRASCRPCFSPESTASPRSNI